MASEAIDKPQMKKKYEDNLKICNEFKGLYSLSQYIENPVEKEIQEPLKKKVKNKKIKESFNVETEEPLRKKIKKVEEKSDEVTNEKRVLSKKNYILIDNIDSSVTTNDMKTYLIENGVYIDKVLVLPGSIGIANFQRQKEMEKLFNVCQGVQYKANELFIFKSIIDKKMEDNYVSNLCETSVHLKNLDLTITEDDISSLVCDLSVKSISINSEKGTAIIEFVDNQSAKKCVNLLDNKIIGEKAVQASFLVKSQRPDVFTLKLSNLPKVVSKNDIQATFPTVLKIKFIKKTVGQCLIHFRNAEDFNAVLNAETEFFIKDNKISVEEYFFKKSKKSELKTQYVLNIYNLPFDTTVSELRGHYPGVRYVEMLKNAEGNFIGSAKLMYDDKSCCEEALKSSKGMTFKHRKVRAEMKIEESGWQNEDRKHDSLKKMDVNDE